MLVHRPPPVFDRMRKIYVVVGAMMVEQPDLVKRSWKQRAISTLPRLLTVRCPLIVGLSSSLSPLWTVWLASILMRRFDDYQRDAIGVSSYSVGIGQLHEGAGGNWRSFCLEVSRRSKGLHARATSALRHR